MTEVRRNEFEIDLRAKGTEYAVRKHMFRIIEELTVQRQSIKEMTQLLDGMMDVLKQVTEVGSVTANAIADFKRRADKNDAIFDNKDE